MLRPIRALPAQPRLHTMPRFAANLSTLFTELPLLERFAAARRAGFEAVEMQFPYGQRAEVLAQHLQEHGLRMVLHNLPPGYFDAGERGLACLPDRVAEFRAGVHQGLVYAQALACPQVHCMVGRPPPGLHADEARACLLDNLRFAAEQARAAGIRLLLEPLNGHDMPGYFLRSVPQALELMDTLGEDNILLQFDIYHAQRTQGELAATLTQLLPRIGHIQLADNPGRCEPGTGEIRFDFLFDHLDALGYTGWIGCEYTPSTTTEQSLAWMRRFLPETPRA